MNDNNELSYKASGVDVDANVSWTQWIAQTVAQDRKNRGITHVGAIGGFAGAFSLPPAIAKTIAERGAKNFTASLYKGETTNDFLEKFLSGFSIVACTDGVGTKTMIAERLRLDAPNALDTLGYDLLAMNVNDMVCGGAIPVAFLDYIGCKGILDERGEFAYRGFMLGLIQACGEAGVELVGGETAEMSDTYTEFGSDLTGCAIGILLKEDIPQAEHIKQGFHLYGLRSSGIHSNGYSLLRKVMKVKGFDWSHRLPSGILIGEEALKPTRLYVKQALAVNQFGLANAMAHITGGGLVENIGRVLPKGFEPRIDWDALPKLEIFEWLREQGVAEEDMRRTFNLGIGYVFATDRAKEELEAAVNEELIHIGEVV